MVCEGKARLIQLPDHGVNKIVTHMGKEG
ncbi:hypothetical protein [Bacillus sp. V3-13]|nr:hypothetical protein [Bacillus sp. V3-13]